jgi:glycosyltransferase involved in cell wall biosynthesis
MKIFFNRVPKYEPYGGGNQFLYRIVEILQERGHEVCYHLEDNIDVIFMMDPRPGDIGYSVDHIESYKRLNPRAKILHRVNECDSRKNTDFMDPLLLRGMKLADSVVFISKWLKEYFVSKGFDANSSVIYNGCDLSSFYPEDIERSSNSPLSIVTHHWSDNYMKGFDIYVEIDKYLQKNPGDFKFTYVGRYWGGYKPSATKIVSPLSGKSLGDELRKHDVYVTASRNEPCGMHHIEGAACGLPVVYHRDTGGIKELCRNHGIEFEDFESFLSGVNKLRSQIKEYREMIDIPSLDINLCCKKYIDLIERDLANPSFKR